MVPWTFEYLIKKLFNLWIPLKINDIVDQCSIMNLSIFWLDQQLHGYYIHGKSPFGISDTNADQLKKDLDS